MIVIVTIITIQIVMVLLKVIAIMITANRKQVFSIFVNIKAPKRMIYITSHSNW
ncbi:hypothetical protein LPICM02_250004 [Pseudolactococcus piscium]|nr:hypothetical protein LPICM02_250004 [Lactococcus piscium]